MVSVIILNYNTFEFSKKCIESVFDKFQGVDYELVLVDNCSSDGSGRELEKFFGEKVKVVYNKSNKGFGVGNNIGVKNSCGDVLFFLNSDAVVEKIDFRKMEEFLKDGCVGVLGGDLVDYSGEKQEFACGKFPNLFRLIKKEKEGCVCDDDFCQVDWVSGAAFFILRKRFEEVGGFDSDIFMYYEDVDLCKRLVDGGYRNYLCNILKVKHFGGGSGLNFLSKKEIYYRSQDYYFRKHYGVLYLLGVKSLRFFYRIIMKNKK